ncbi:P-loop containing nucleoside triphosphate hydrolase protein [Gloeopeniophorella convolvens]|nr:P-loop containing nucleoside triphosphate hydrolase protein [Gloeopeniophorella convolvens]
MQMFPSNSTLSEHLSDHAKSDRSKRPDDLDLPTGFRHHAFGIWDLYVEVPLIKWRLPLLPNTADRTQLLNNLQYLVMAVRDLSSPVLFSRLAVSSALSLSPAISLWFTGNFLRVVQDVSRGKELDKTKVVLLACGRVACSLAHCLLERADGWLYLAFDDFVKRYYAQYAFEHIARVDLPTFMDPLVSQQLNAVSLRYGFCSVGRTIDNLLRSGCNVFVLFAQVSVLLTILHEQRIGVVLSLATCFCHLVICILSQKEISHSNLDGLSYAATTRNQDYIKSEGLKQLVSDGEHRQEIVAGGLGQYLTNHFLELNARLGNRGGEFWSHFLQNQRQMNSTLHMLKWVAGELPEIIFTIIIVQNLGDLPMALATFTLVQATAKNLRFNLSSIFQQSGDIANQLANLRSIYAIRDIKNKVPDGTLGLRDGLVDGGGISLEFVNVSFRYPGSDSYALRDVSFRVSRGHLCVIVGSNGSGKSTILKLVARIYDATEGTILINGRNIRELKLGDLRRSIAVLFQDYTLFPLSIKDNIAFGDTRHATDTGLIRKAARLGGADVVIKRLPEKWDTYLSRPDSVHNVIRIQREDKTGEIDRTLRQMTGMQPPQGLSGGEQQRIAVARTFMRTLATDSSVGLLLFDEPSAALDPVAEHDLFSRLHESRGNRTMIFSSHRFGKLTKHADVIMYMNESAVVEIGTHERLMEAQGAYARLWRLQAEAFK